MSFRFVNRVRQSGRQRQAGTPPEEFPEVRAAVNFRVAAPQPTEPRPATEMPDWLSRSVGARSEGRDPQRHVLAVTGVISAKFWIITTQFDRLNENFEAENFPICQMHSSFTAPVTSNAPPPRDKC